MNPLKEYIKELADKYNVVCGVCGYQWVDQPEVCHCGNDVEFEVIAE